MDYRIDADTMKSLQKAQENEITEYHIYLVPPEKVGVKREKYINEKGFPYLMSNL